MQQSLMISFLLLSLACDLAISQESNESCSALCDGDCIQVDDEGNSLSGDWSLMSGQEAGGSCWDGGCRYVNDNGDEHCFCFVTAGWEVQHEDCEGCPTGEGVLSSSCPPGWSQYQQKCYKRVIPPLLLTWENARLDCIDIGGVLASVESQCEQEFVASLSAGVDAWLGGSDLASEGTFTWTGADTTFYLPSGAVSGVYSNFEADQPSDADTQHCLIMIGLSGTWNDVVCSTTKQHVCEQQAYEGASTATTPAPVTECSVTCDSGWTPFDCVCYRLEQTKMNWTDARASCQGLKAGADLASMTSADLELQLLGMAGGGDTSDNEWWTGGNDIANEAQEFVWSFDSSVFWEWEAGPITHGYSNWFSTVNVQQPNHAPDQNCVKIKIKVSDGSFSTLGWDDVTCTKLLNYACQYSP